MLTTKTCSGHAQYSDLQSLYNTQNMPACTSDGVFCSLVDIIDELV